MSPVLLGVLEKGHLWKNGVGTPAGTEAEPQLSPVSEVCFPCTIFGLCFCLLFIFCSSPGFHLCFIF